MINVGKKFLDLLIGRIHVMHLRIHIQFLLIFTIHLKQHDAYTPNIHSFIVLSPIPCLGRHVISTSTTSRIAILAEICYLGHSKVDKVQICDLILLVIVEDYVVRFDISVINATPTPL